MDSSVTVELMPAVRDAQSTPGNVILLSINSPSSMQLGQGHPLQPLFFVPCLNALAGVSHMNILQLKYTKQDVFLL
jgi:hypothetical protein